MLKAVQEKTCKTVMGLAAVGTAETLYLTMVVARTSASCSLTEFRSVVEISPCSTGVFQHWM